METATPPVKSPAWNNKFLVPRETVVFTPSTEAVALQLEEYFKRANHVAYISRALSTPDDQLKIIRNFLTKRGLDKKYTAAMTCAVTEFDKQLNQYVWQMAWSNLLNVGIIINPPIKAVCLMDTTFDNRNRKGKIIQESTHFRGSALDIGGAANGIDDEVAIVRKAMDEKMTGLVSFKPEHENNAVHCECKPILPK